MYLRQLGEQVDTLRNSLDPGVEVQVVLEAGDGEVYEDGDILQVDGVSYDAMRDTIVVEASAEA